MLKKMKGLFKFEYEHYGMFNIIILGIALLAVSLAPIMFEQYDDKYVSTNVRLVMVPLTVGFIFLTSLLLLIASLNKDIKIKELWLHNSQSIYRLIGVKVIYHGLVMIIINIIPYIGYYFTDVITGTISEYFVLYLYYLFILVVLYISGTLLALFLLAVYKQISKFLGKLSVAVTFVIFILLMDAIEEIPTNYLEVGKISLLKLQEFAVGFPGLEVTVISEIYILQLLFDFIVSIISYMLICKWIERLAMR